MPLIQPCNVGLFIPWKSKYDFWGPVLPRADVPAVTLLFEPQVNTNGIHYVAICVHILLTDHCTHI